MVSLTRRWFVTGGALVLAAAAADLEPAPAQTPPRTVGSPDPRLVEDLVAANRILADQNVLDGYGHVSARHDRDPSRYLMSRSLARARPGAGRDARAPHGGAHARPRRSGRGPVAAPGGLPQRLPRDKCEAPGPGNGAGRPRDVPRPRGGEAGGGVGRLYRAPALGALEE